MTMTARKRKQHRPNPHDLRQLHDAVDELLKCYDAECDVRN